MTNASALYVFQVIASVSTIITLLPQALLNYRRKSTDHLSAFTIILWTAGAEVSAVYLIWTYELLIISSAYAAFAGIALFIGCQIRFYHRKKPLVLPAKFQGKRCQLFMTYVIFAGNYILLLLGALMNGLALYHIFELTKSRSWASKLIGSIIPTITDSIGFIPQIILIIRKKSASGYSLLFILTEFIGAIAGIVSVFLLETFDVVPLISFLDLFIFQMIILVLKVCVFTEKRRKRNNILPIKQTEGKFQLSTELYLSRSLSTTVAQI